jgi:hypothetical protein
VFDHLAHQVGINLRYVRGKAIHQSGIAQDVDRPRYAVTGFGERA